MRNNRCFGGLTVKMLCCGQMIQVRFLAGAMFFTLNHLHCHHQRMLRLGSVFVRALLVWHRWEDRRPIRRRSPGRSPEERGRKKFKQGPLILHWIWPTPHTRLSIPLFTHLLIHGWIYFFSLAIFIESAQTSWQRRVTRALNRSPYILSFSSEVMWSETRRVCPPYMAEWPAKPWP